MKKIVFPILLVFLSSCNKNYEKVTLPQFDTKLSQIDVSAKTILTDSDGLIKKYPDENKMCGIRDSASSIAGDTEFLKKATIDIKGTISDLQKENAKIKKERDKAIEDKNSTIQKMLKWLIGISIVGCSVCFVVFFMFGSKWGIGGAIACGGVLVISIALQKFFLYFALAGAGLLLMIIVILIYNVWIKNRAFTEVVNTVEVTQDKLAETDKKELFGGVGENGLMDKIQSKTTMDMVKKEKVKMSRLWDYAKKKSEKCKSSLNKPAN
jgi:hypothetical protein